MKRTGVILGVERMPKLEFNEWSAEVIHRLKETYPGVEFAFVGGAQSVVFEFDDGKEQPPLPPPIRSVHAFVRPLETEGVPMTDSNSPCRECGKPSRDPLHQENT